jgi:two-component system, cell cycle sensor histidine kinase and response regulator CckA
MGMTPKSLLNDEKRLAWVLEVAGNGFWEWNIETGQMKLSGMWAATLGYAPGDVPDDITLFDMLVHPADLEQTREAFQAHLDGTTESVSVKYRLKAKSGEWHWSYDRAKVVERGPSGNPLRLVGISTDITEQKSLAAQLLQAQRLENIGRLAGAVAHDFNNLLTVINGYSEIALGSLDQRDPLFESIREIKSAGDRAASLTQQLLAFSRRQVMQARILDITDVVGDLESMLRRLIGEDIHLVLARTAGTWCVKADPVQMQQVIMNLAVNARDAMPHGGQLLIGTENVTLDEEAVRVQPDGAPGDWVLVTVTDGGTGMDEATMSRLFEPFFTTKEKGKGTGLGLSTVYGIVKQSGGHVWVESKPGQGTTFRVYLPKAAEADQAATIAPTTSAARGTETILLVEDQAAVRQLTLHALGIYGYRVLSAANGAEALAIARQETVPIDLVLSDVVMPGMTGPDLARTLTSLRPGIKILLMSGYTDDKLSGGAMPPGLDYLQKPFTPDSLARKVRQVLDARPAGGRVLVVDDEAEIRKLLRQFLEHAGYQVAEASNGRQAVSEVDAGGVALVITDLVMPEKEGIETIREMRQRHREVKIIAMSGAFGGRFLRTAEMLGAHATLSKPVRAEQLVRAVRDVLGAQG